MKRINVSTTVLATVQEEWVLEVPDDYVLPPGGEDPTLLDLIDKGRDDINVNWICDTVTTHESREVVSFEVLGAVTVAP